MESALWPKSLREARERASLSQEDLAKRLNINRTAISQWETGLTVPSGPSRQLLSIVFAMPLTTIAEWFAPAPEAVAS